MRIETPAVDRLIEFPLGVGESPVWASEEQALYFVDILAPALFRFDVATRAVKRWDMPSAIGSFGLCADGRAVVALRHGVHLFDFRAETLTFLAHPEPDRPHNRLNDGKIGPDGRFWIGSMDDRPEKEATGALYRVDVDGSFIRICDGLQVSNGLAFAPDGRTLYHSDSRGRYLQAFDLDPRTGDASRQRRIRTFDDAEGRPDGGACDVEGYYWSAGVSAGRLNRIAPDGTIERILQLPISAPTMPCFGGPDMKTLFVTSLTPADNADAGTLISLRVDVAGAPVARFGEPLPLD